MPNIIEITDFLSDKLDVYARMKEPQLLHINEPYAGIFIAESPEVIRLALTAGYQPISLLTEEDIETKLSSILPLCGDIPVYTAKEDILTKITGFKLTRGALCAMKRKPLPSPAEICRNAKRVAVLENVVNPTNVGAIIRCAAALGMDAVLLTPASSDPLYRRAARVSMGTVFQVPWTYLDNDTDYIDKLKEMNFKTAAMTLTDNSIDLDKLNIQSEEKLAVILGTEGDGLLDTTIERCDYTVKIPMYHNVDSLNVAAAAAVVFWQLRA